MKLNNHIIQHNFVPENIVKKSFQAEYLEESHIQTSSKVLIYSKLRGLE